MKQVEVERRMSWKTLLAYITGTVDQELLLRNEYLVTENRILRNQIKGRVGSATQVMLARVFCATVGQKQHRKQGDHQQPWSSERRAHTVDRSGTRKMAIPAMGSRTISVTRASASLWPQPKTVASGTSSAP